MLEDHMLNVDLYFRFLRQFSFSSLWLENMKHFALDFSLPSILKYIYLLKETKSIPCLTIFHL